MFISLSYHTRFPDSLSSGARWLFFSPFSFCYSPEVIMFSPTMLSTIFPVICWLNSWRQSSFQPSCCSHSVFIVIRCFSGDNSSENIPAPSKLPHLLCWTSFYLMASSGTTTVHSSFSSSFCQCFLSVLSHFVFIVCQHFIEILRHRFLYQMLVSGSKFVG